MSSDCPIQSDIGPVKRTDDPFLNCREQPERVPADPGSVMEFDCGDPGESFQVAFLSFPFSFKASPAYFPFITRFLFATAVTYYLSLCWYTRHLGLR